MNPLQARLKFLRLGSIATIFAGDNQSPLRKLAMTGAAWTFAGYGATQVLRLGSNLILTRLLFPEAFGLMAIVQVWMVGLQLFSDVGIVPAIIQSKRGDDPDFLNTAWSIQVVRGTALWICSGLLAWPAAALYHEPMLQYLLPVVGVNAFISGFNATKLATVNRNLSLKRLVAIETIAYAMGLLVMILWALHTKTVWSLVGGGIFTTLVKMVASHKNLSGPSNKWHFDRQSFHDLRKFGSWIFLSSIVTFLVGQGDRLLIGYLLDVRFLAFYSLAVGMSNLFQESFRSIGGKVLFPAYSKVVRENPDNLYQVLRKSRFLQITASGAISLFFILFGQHIMSMLYDARYIDSGWMLQLLAVGQFYHVLESSNVGVLMALGNTKTMTLLLTIQSILQFITVPLAYYFLGNKGIIFGVILSKFLFYPINLYFFYKLKLWQPEIDIPFWIIFTTISILFFSI
jgi:O-antigen/teichoic acid export membrane protein